MKHPAIVFSTFIALLCLFLVPAQAAESAWDAAEKEKWDGLVEQTTELFQKSEYERAIEIEKQALNLAEQSVGPDHPDTGQNLNALGTLYSLTKNYKKAEPLLERALTVSEKLSDLKGQKTILDNMAEMYQGMENFPKAEKYFSRSLGVTEQIYGQKHPAVAKVLGELGVICFVQGKLDKAEPLLKRAVAMTEENDGANSDGVGIGLGILGKLYLYKGDFIKAEESLSRALPLRERALGPKSHIVTRMQNDLAGAYSEQGKFDEAIPLLERAIATNEKIYPSNHPEIALNFFNFGGAYIGQARYDQAIKVLERSLAIHDKLNGDSLDAALVLDKLAVAHFKLGEYDKAETLAEREAAILSKTFGPDSSQTQMLKKQIEMIRDERRKTVRDTQ